MAEQPSIRNTAMDMLARREHSRLELSRKLRKRFGDHHDEQESEFAGEAEESSIEDQIEAVIDQLAAEGLQSDERLAEAFVRARVSRGQGPVKIKAELRGRGVSDDQISQAMAACDVDWFELARNVAERKFGEPHPVDDYDEARRQKARVARFMQQRGFSFEHISSLT